MIIFMVKTKMVLSQQPYLGWLRENVAKKGGDKMAAGLSEQELFKQVAPTIRWRHGCYCCSDKELVSWESFQAFQVRMKRLKDVLPADVYYRLVIRLEEKEFIEVGRKTGNVYFTGLHCVGPRQIVVALATALGIKWGEEWTLEYLKGL
jgi:hypothetical protein